MAVLVTTPKEVTVVTKNGECTLHITLDININLSSSGVISGGPKEEKLLVEQDKTVFEIPEFKPTEKVKFGKSE
jgi:hypothetical protein